EPFLCYHCHQTSDECNEGDLLRIQFANCSTNECFVLKYETQMPGVKVMATFRGCLQMPEHELMKNVVTEHHVVTKKHFHLCNNSLCNGACVRMPVIGGFYMLIFLHVLLYFGDRLI
ncbi:hypothetical protein JTB14_037772, partial [Gonioctena quinquepunctata]